MIAIGRRVGVQRGMVLIVSLVILLSLTLLGLAAIQNTTLEERMAGNLRAENIGLQAAEAALRAGEAAVAAWNSQPVPQTANPGSTGVWELDFPAACLDTALPAGDEYLWWQSFTAADWVQCGVGVTGALKFRGIQESAEFSASQLSAPAPVFLLEDRGSAMDSLVIGQQGDLVGLRIYQVTGRGTDLANRGEAIVRSTFGRRF